MAIKQPLVTNWPVRGLSGTEYEKDAYEALTAEELKAEGFIHDPKVVYTTIEDKVPDFSGKNKQYTLEAVGTIDGKPTKIPVATKIHNMEENHFNWNNVPIPE